LLLSAIGDAQSAQPTDETPYVVRFGTYGIEVWQFTGPDTGLERIWITRTVVSEEYAEEWAGRGLFGFHAPRGVVADLDNDGTSELIAVDGFGILIYGTTNPQYIPFAEARTSDVYTKLLVVDLDNDGNKEIVVHRRAPESGPLDRGREISVWRRDEDGYESVWRRDFAGPGWTVLFADVDNDGEGELITASDTIVILESTGLFEWEVAAELPNVGRVGGGAVIDVVRVADVDGDGLNEIIASGNSGAVTVYKHTYNESTKRSTYPVVWQSRPLVSAELGPMPDRGDGPRPPWAYTQGLGVGDVDGDGAIEIVVATAQFGQRPGAEPGKNGQIHVFEHTATRWFERRWLSDWTTLANIPGIAIGDVDGDGNVGWVYNGTEIYDFDPATGDFVLEGEFPGQALNAIVSEPFEFNEPRDAVRLLPVKWDAPSAVSLTWPYHD